MGRLATLARRSGDPIRFDIELLEMVEETRSAIATAIPAVVDAPLTVVRQFY